MQLYDSSRERKKRGLDLACSMNLSHLSQTGEINNFQLFSLLLHHDDIHSLSLSHQDQFFLSFLSNNQISLFSLSLPAFVPPWPTLYFVLCFLYALGLRPVLPEDQTVHCTCQHLVLVGCLFYIDLVQSSCCKPVSLLLHCVCKCKCECSLCQVRSLLW